MPPPNLRFGGGGVTHFSPIVMLAMLAVAALIFLLPRKYVIAPFLAAAFLIPMTQVLVVGPFHFQSLRILIFLGLMRLIATKGSSQSEIFSGGINAIDKALIFATAASSVAFVVLWHQTGAVINQLGTFYTVFGLYFLLRFLIRDENGVERAIRMLIYISFLIAADMMLEHFAGYRPYTFLTGAPVWTRDGGVRAMADFGNPILAGVFGATTFPLFVALRWKTGKYKFLTLAGMVAATIIVVTSLSSTPELAYIAGIGALCLWPFRKKMRLIRWGTVAGLVCLQIVMKAPVWALIARMDVVGGSSGYHRYMLVDQFIRRFGDWWLLGTSLNASWGWDMWDTANTYVWTGETGGLLAFIFFIGILVYAFKYLGRERKASEGDKRRELFIWAMGATLFAHAVAFFGIIYFDQTMVLWYGFLAMTSVITYRVWRSPVTQVEPQAIPSNPFLQPDRLPSK